MNKPEPLKRGDIVYRGEIPHIPVYRLRDATKWLLNIKIKDILDCSKQTNETMIKLASYAVEYKKKVREAFEDVMKGEVRERVKNMDLKKQVLTEWDDKPDEFIVTVTLGELREIIRKD